MKKIVVTGGLGFIGINLVEYLLKKNFHVICIDKISYASNQNIFRKNPKFTLKKIDICEKKKLRKIIFYYKPDIIFHLAAESHVDNSIENSKVFIKSNILGTYSLLEVLREYSEKYKRFKLIHVSTDEVYGSIKKGQFSEINKFYPNSPYSASKASSDMLVRAWNKTFNLPVITTNCSNNFGPYQNKEKLIPKIIFNLIHKKKIPIYGNGKNMRDWIFVKDHAKILFELSKYGKIGETYNIGSNSVLSNIVITKKLINIHKKNDSKFKSKFSEVIKFVTDRKGHDFRYAINTSKIKKLGVYKFGSNMQKNLEITYKWYLNFYKK
ncbi:dTDP-glucose 4,6-dehydratase [Candidatus Pelagibacter sp.]|uniref:dTDP-glucose 4,6-dehydratase n=1 Tax=Candidatus Pelagibacter sp. TaxID=2024849 RepID=UPI003F854FF9